MDAIESMLPEGVEFEQRPALDGHQAVVWFDNGYGASVVNHRGSYGLELAVIHGRGSGGLYDFDLCYATPVTGDVLGNLTAESLSQALNDINALPRNDECDHGSTDMSGADPFTMLDSLFRML